VCACLQSFVGKLVLGRCEGLSVLKGLVPRWEWCDARLKDGPGRKC
jgi:hypothetical protein